MGEPGRSQSVSRRRSAAGKSRTAIAGAAGGEAGTGAGARASANGAAGVTDFGAAGSTATPPARRKTKSRRRPAVLADQASLVSSAELAALRARAPKVEPPPAPPGAPAAASAEEPAITDDELRELLPEVCAAAGEMITSRVGCTPLTDKETGRMGRAIAKLLYALGFTVTNPIVGGCIAVGASFAFPIIARKGEIDQIAKAKRELEANGLNRAAADAIAKHRSADQVGPIAPIPPAPPAAAAPAAAPAPPFKPPPFLPAAAPASTSVSSGAA